MNANCKTPASSFLFFILLFLFPTQFLFSFSTGATLVSPNEMRRLGTDVKDDKDFYSRQINQRFPNQFSLNTELIDKIISFPDKKPRSYIELISFATQTLVLELNRTSGDGNLYFQGEPSTDFPNQYEKIRFILELFQLRAKSSGVKLPFSPESMRFEGLKREIRAFWNRPGFQ